MTIGCGSEVITRHPRSYEREDMIFDPFQCLPLIERKINSFDQVAPLDGRGPPSEFATLHRLKEARMIKTEWTIYRRHHRHGVSG
ncbi:hypothetical protein [Paludibacillus litoralis]|uniref:hypothetical protein n=1 Tax=Paludibacillus litoralis TaxID=3133267 RepID=UPI0039B72749